MGHLQCAKSVVYLPTPMESECIYGPENEKVSDTTLDWIFYMLLLKLFGYMKLYIFLVKFLLLYFCSLCDESRQDAIHVVLSW